MKVKFILLLMICPFFFGGRSLQTIAGSGLDTGFNNGSFCGDHGPATLACLHNPADVTVDNNGNIFIADVMNIRIRKVNNLGIINTIAGTGPYGYYGDDGLATNAMLVKLIIFMYNLIVHY